jgi:hypothetical protein
LKGNRALPFLFILLGVILSITIDDVKSKLLTLDDVRERLARTEPLTTHEFGSNDGVAFRLEPDFNHGLDALPGNLAIPGYVSIGQTELQLTRDALYEIAAEAKMSKGFLKTYSAELVSEVLNSYVVSGMDGKSYKILGIQGDKAAAIPRASVMPYSNLRLLDTALESIQAQYGEGQVFADYKFVHDLQRTHLRLIIPEHVRTIQNTGTDNDTWSVGIQIKNSLTGLEQTEINGYLFRYWCTNGAIDTRSNSNAVWSRRGRIGRDEDAVFEWAKDAVDEVLGGFESSFDAVQAMTEINIEGSAREALNDVFSTYRIPGPHRDRIISSMINEDTLTMYSLMQAVTEAANADNLNAVDVDRLMRAGGDLPAFVEEGRCNPEHPCGRFLHNH